VTNLSGRGVGLDVVKRNITALRGTVGMSSEEGVGTTVTVRLPLTLAIIDGFLVGVDKAVCHTAGHDRRVRGLHRRARPRLHQPAWPGAALHPSA
jgi:hypothetical protein